MFSWFFFTQFYLKYFGLFVFVHSCVFISITKIWSVSNSIKFLCWHFIPLGNQENPSCLAVKPYFVSLSAIFLRNCVNLCDLPINYYFCYNNSDWSRCIDFYIHLSALVETEPDISSKFHSLCCFPVLWTSTLKRTGWKECRRNQSPHRRSQGKAHGAMTPKFLAYLVILCFKKRRPKQKKLLLA